MWKYQALHLASLMRGNHDSYNKGRHCRALTMYQAPGTAPGAAHVQTHNLPKITQLRSRSSVPKVSVPCCSDIGKSPFYLPHTLPQSLVRKSNKKRYIWVNFG